MDESDTRACILEAAKVLFGQKGFAATSVREVVEAAGISKPTLYYYFRNKDELYRECIRSTMSGLGDLVDGAVHGQGTVRERLVSFCEAYVRGGLEDPTAVRLLLNATVAPEGQPDLPILATLREEMHRLTELFVQGQAAGELRSMRCQTDCITAVHMLTGAADMLLLAGIDGAEITDDFADRLVDLLYRGLAR